MSKRRPPIPFGLTRENVGAFIAELNALPTTGPLPWDVDVTGASPLVRAAIEEVRAKVARIEEARGAEIVGQRRRTRR